MAWLWVGRQRAQSRSRPRVAQAIAEARQAHMGAADAMTTAPGLGSAVVAADQVRWAYTPTARAEELTGVALGSAGATDGGRRGDFGEMGALLERAEDTARKLGRSRSEMWEEALRVWLATQDDEGAQAESLPRPAPRPWLFEARRQRVWGEIDQTLDALRTA